LSVAVVATTVVIACSTGEWGRLWLASLGGLISFALFFIVNLMNPRWMAFGDVRLSFVFGFGLAWVSPIDLFEAFFYANVLALVAGLILLVARRADRRSAMPFGVFMALGAALMLIT
jgi:leader peptidase (prepilin peptidase) / N-methyltransferase